MRAPGEKFSREEGEFMRRALQLARKGFGGTSPNPMVGSVIVRDGLVIGEGFHKRAGEAHAEVNAMAAARRAGKDIHGATLYVTLEPCSTFGRTPPCTSAIIDSGISEVIAGAIDPNAKHAGKGFEILRKAGIRVRHGLLAEECTRLNEAFNHWISQRRPFVVCKCAMSLDGKIATNSGDSKWITGAKARAFGMRLRLGADAIVAGVNTILRDDPALTLRPGPGFKIPAWKKLRRIVLDPNGRIPESARVLTDENAALTTVVVTEAADSKRIKALERQVRVIVSPRSGNEINLRWLTKLLGQEEVTSLLVEGGGETHYSFLRQSLVGRVHFFHAPLVITGRNAAKAVGGERTLARGRGLSLRDVEWTKIGEDLLCSALVAGRR
jgi:diaminohydroxyphosphoribosylaminopyrimidine deaminase / 5-amino-6-(5-phosphoribosylamino)uracil reductase